MLEDTGGSSNKDVSILNVRRSVPDSGKPSAKPNMVPGASSRHNTAHTIEDASPKIATMATVNNKPAPGTKVKHP